MSKRYILDSYAWVEYLEGSAKGDRVREILQDSRSESYTCAITLAEVVSKAVRKNLSYEVAYSAITRNSRVIEANSQISKKAGVEHANMRKKVRDFSLADAYVLTCSTTLKATIVTGDPHFEDVPGVELLT